MASSHAIPRYKLRQKFFLGLLALGTFMLAVYMVRSLAQEEQIATRHSRVKVLSNINDLMPLTQPHEHLQRQKLYESMVHSKIRAQVERQNSRFSGVRIPKWVHIDLKGAPFKVEFYKHLFPYLNKLGANGILLEYEDMFPYQGDVAAKNAYTQANIAAINSFAAKNRLAIIPLIQTFGHLEFVLKLEQYRNLREVPRYMQSICPSRDESFALLTKMIDQVVQSHPNITHLHIGCDEVEHIGICDQCQAALDRNNWKPYDLFLNHVLRLAKYIKEKHKVQAIIWDDMLRNINEDVLQSYELGKYVEIVVWNYNPTFDFPDSLWQTYSQAFPKIWVASSFKGATGPSKFYTNITFHLENHKCWLNFLKDNDKLFKYQGIVLTGWQRYNHFAVLCELFPSAIPSLAANMYFLENGEVLQGNLRKTLGCPEEWSTGLQVEPLLCNFPGAKIYKGILKLLLLEKKAKKLYGSNYLAGWLTDFNIKHNFSSPSIIAQAMDQLDEAHIAFIMLKTYMSNTMPQLYDNYTIAEWVEQNLAPYITKLSKIQKLARKLSAKSSFPKRPFLLPFSLQR